MFYTCYCMCMLGRRLQILLDEDRFARVARCARDRGVSVARVMREAVDALLPAVTTEKAAAAEKILSAEKMPVPDIEEMLSELDEWRGRRG